MAFTERSSRFGVIPYNIINISKRREWRLAPRPLRFKIITVFRKDMALAEELPVYKAAYDLVLVIFTLAKSFNSPLI